MSGASVAAATITRLTQFDVAAYELDEIPNPFPVAYAEVHVSPRLRGQRRVGAGSPVRGWAVTLRFCAKTVTNLHQLSERADQALTDWSTVIDGRRTSPWSVYDPGIPPDQDDDRYYSTPVEWVFAI